MKLGYIGLGKMGANMVERLVKDKGHEVIGFDPSEEAREKAKATGATIVDSLQAMVDQLEAPRVIMSMVPHKVVRDVVAELTPMLSQGDTFIEAANSPYKQSIELHKEMKEKGIDFLDAGISGGPGGARNGACAMVGGDKDVYDRLEPLFKDIGTDGGYAYLGGPGAGHFVKMVHNGIEYGMMQAIGEGFEVMKKSDFNLDLKQVAELYTHGTVVTSSLVAWLRDAYEKYGVDLDEISGEVSHSGEGQWTVETAKEMGIPVPIIEASLQFRKDSQGNPSYTGQVVSAQRNMFGGHDVSKK